MEDDSLPRLLILHDSIMNGVDPARLGRGYGLHVTKKKAATITDCLQTAEKAAPHDAILLHTGLNDLKTTGAQDANQRLVTCVKTILTANQKAQVIVSNATPTTRPDLTAKRELFNALCFAALHDSDRVTFVAHNAQIGNDRLHLTPRGASIVAGNTGRHVAGLFWQKQRSRGHRRPRHQQANRPTDTHSKRQRPSQRTSLPQQQQPPRNHRHYQPPGNRYKDSFLTGGYRRLQHHQPERRGHYWRDDRQGSQQGRRERDDPRRGRHHYDYRRDHQPSAYRYRHHRDW